MSVSSTAAALTPAIFQRNGSRDARAPSDEVRTFLRCDATSSRASDCRLLEGDEDTVRTVTLPAPCVSAVAGRATACRHACRATSHERRALARPIAH